MKTYFQAILSFLHHYIHHFREVWKIRKSLDTPIREENEYDFLPAHLELIEKPVSVLPRRSSHLIMLFILITCGWAIFGKVDIVSTATGKIAYSGNSKIIQPIENAIVENIYVNDGQMVEKGELLLELTSLGAKEELQKANQALNSAKLAKTRAHALLDSIYSNVPPSLQIDDESISSVEQQQSQQLILAQFNTYLLQQKKAAALLEQKRAEFSTIKMQIKKYQSLQRLEKEKTNDLAKLLKLNAVSKHQYLEQETKYIDIKNEILTLESKLNEINAEIQQAKDEQNLLTNTFIRDTQDSLRQANEQIKQLVFEKEKYIERQKTTQIKAPVTGSIQQLVVHTIGGVVTTAQPLMVVVPKHDKLEVKAIIGNQDIGFIRQGQEVTVKVETFPYTRYGYLTGKVKSLSFDAIETEKVGLAFAAIIELDKDYLIIENHRVNLTAGMMVNAEIKTGRRSVISYLLSPLQSTFSESFTER
ncbi:hemolysin D [Rodentibacter genomosp. 1]|uniref:Membrane fusion protein (MFP) family protein n=1 Tax=Rodentibacter genomosp. 1 TaxID=1908264 RepID=A0A1V3J8P1_9PAST|nr:HlyD family type I secretion periplasmic adaptor subunit [Rodentibacter genomosp. 1]OOF51592.1 hemolysin D [Rodentibacter genomosp. 1]